jgi:hypothetical protein
MTGTLKINKGEKMAIKNFTIKCQYAYDGSSDNVSFEDKKTYPEEEWEIILVTPDTKPFIILNNVSNGYTEHITLSTDLYNKIILDDKKDLADYLKIAFEQHRSKSKEQK